MSDSRPRLNQLFKLVETHAITKVVVEHKDRLTRFNFGVYERFFNSHGVVIECTEDKREKSYEQELVDDMISLMSSFSAKIYGKAEALRQNGLQDLIGRPASELLLGIVNRCGGTNGSINAADARSALARLMDKLLEQAETPAEVEAVLSENATGMALADLLMNFFGYYVYEQFCRVFFEHLVKKHGEQRAESFLGDILEFVHAALRNHTLEMDVARIEWFGPQGAQITSSIMQLTLEVFER